MCSPDKDGDRGDVKVFSLLPSFFSLGVDDTLDSLGLLFLATCGSREEHLKKSKVCEIMSDNRYLLNKVIIEKSRGEGSPMEQDTIKNDS